MHSVDVHERTGSLVLQADDPFSIRELIPASKTVAHGHYNVAVKWEPEAVRVLRNLGYNAPSRETYKYPWPGKFKPLPHQRAMVDFYLANAKGYNLSEQGSMKTAPSLWAADILMRIGLIHKVLIIAPLSILERVWLQEIFDVLMHRQAVVVHGGEERRKKALATDADFYILNHEGVTRPDVFDEIKRRHDIDLVIVDEGGLFRNSGTDRYKALKAMLLRFGYIWWLTGTPMPRAPTDAWAQARVVTPSSVPRFFGHFRAQTMIQVNERKWTPREGAERLVYRALQPAIRFMKRDCINLPPVTTINLQAELSEQQRIAFKEMRNYMQAELAQGIQITAVNAADKINKCRQILCGAVKQEDETYTVLPHKPRLKVLEDAIDAAGAKVIIIAPFKGITQALEKELSKTWTVGVLNGDVSLGRRNKIIVAFKTTPDPRILLCHPRVMSHGLNLTEADTLIFYAPIYSNDEYRQVIERFNRFGQTRKMTIVRIAAHAMEWAIYQSVDKQQVTQLSILNLYREIAMNKLV